MLPNYPEAKRRAFARNLLRNALRVSRGEDILIESWSATLPWATSLALEARAVGARALLSVKDEDAYWRSLSLTPSSQLGRVGDHEWAALKASDAYVYLYGPMDAAREEALPDAVVRRANSNEHELMRVIQKYGVRTVRWDLGRTSELWARRYGIDLGSWRAELIEASMFDPRVMRRDGLAIADRLRRGSEATVSHPNGTALTLRLAHRRPKVDDGVIDDEDVKAGNVVMVIPSGVTSVTVNELRGEGTFVSNAMGVLYVDHGEHALAPGRWTFRRGSLETYSFPGARTLMGRPLARMGNPRVRLGQLSVGLNPRIATIPLLFDQARGRITLQIGRNTHLGGKSRHPALQAYLDLEGATLDIDGERIVNRGKLAL
jgi:leucyl aminopeptidase (aminopeptidase T)